MRIHLTKLAAFAVLALALVSLSGCLPKEQGGGVDWPRVIECADGVTDLIGIVTDALMSQDMEQTREQLTELGLEHGPANIACLVEAVRSDWAMNAQRMRAADPAWQDQPRRERAYARAVQWLACPSGDTETCTPIEPAAAGSAP